MIVIDIWGGPDSQELLARFIRKLDEAWAITQQALVEGYLVNLRQDLAWGPEQEFDLRKPKQ